MARRKRVAAPKDGCEVATQIREALTSSTHNEIRERVLSMMTQLSETFAERNDAIRCMTIAMLTGMNYLLIGSRGTAKTAMANCMMAHVDHACHFSTLLGTFTTLNDLIGRIDLAALQRGEEKRRVEGKLLDCDTAFLDEVLKGGDGTVNSLLGVLSDNRDFDGVRTRLWSIGSATNWPEVERRSDKISALYDRFHLKIPVQNVMTREARMKVLRTARLLRGYEPKNGSTFALEDLKGVSKEIFSIAISSEIEEMLCSIQERCSKENIEVSDRKLGQWQAALQASAWLNGSGEVGIEDFDVLLFMAWDDKREFDKVRAIIQSCDMELTQAIVRKIDEVRKEYAELRQQGFDAAKGGRLIDNIKRVVLEVKAAMQKYRLKPESQKDIGIAAKRLHADYTELFERYNVALNPNPSFDQLQKADDNDKKIGKKRSV